MTIELIEIVPLKNDFTQIPNSLINSDIENQVFRCLCWLLSKRGGSISSRQLSQAARVGYDGQPHRRLMKELRALGVLTSVVIYENNMRRELLRIDLNKVLTVTSRSKPQNPRGRTNCRSGRTNCRSGRTSCTTDAVETYEPLKTNCDGARPQSHSEARPVAETLSEKQRVAQSLGLRVHPKSGECKS